MGKVPTIDSNLVKKYSIKEIKVFRYGHLLRQYTFDRSGLLSREQIKKNVEYLYQDGQKYRGNNYGKKPPFGRYSLHDFQDSLMTITYFDETDSMTRKTEFRYLEASRHNLHTVTTYRDGKKVITSHNYYDRQNKLVKNEFRMSGPIRTIKEYQYPDPHSTVERIFDMQGGAKKLRETITTIERKMPDGSTFHSKHKSGEASKDLVLTSNTDGNGQLLDFEIIDEDKGGKGAVTFHSDGRPNYITWHGEHSRYLQHYRYHDYNGLLREINFTDFDGNVVKKDRALIMAYEFYPVKKSSFRTLPLPFRLRATFSYDLQPN